MGWVGSGRLGLAWLVMALEGVVYSRTWPAHRGAVGRAGRAGQREGGGGERKREEREEKINTVGLVRSSRFSPPSYRILSYRETALLYGP